MTSRVIKGFDTAENCAGIGLVGFDTNPDAVRETQHSDATSCAGYLLSETHIGKNKQGFQHLFVATGLATVDRRTAAAESETAPSAAGKIDSTIKAVMKSVLDDGAKVKNI